MLRRTRNTINRQSALFLTLAIAVVGTVTLAAFFLIGHVFILERQLGNIDWNLPATIYAEPPAIFPGKAISSDWLVEYLHRLDYMPITSPAVQPGQYSVKSDGVLFNSRPSKENRPGPVLVSFINKRVATIQDVQNHKRIGRLLLEPTPLATLFGDEWEKRTLVKLNDLPKHVVDAVVSIEDRRFYQHSGVDMISVGRALWSNVLDKGPLQGGSTITQQLVKNLYLSPERTIRRKMSEALMAIVMESKYSKQQILEFYLNEVYLGQRGPVSIRGIGEASQLYFKKDARLLTVPEAATLAGLIQAPSRYDPYQHPDRALMRRNTVLTAMKETGTLRNADYERYSHADLQVQVPDKKINRAPYFLTFVKKQLKEQFSNSALQQDNYKVISTLDYDMQLAAQQALSDGLSTIDRIRGQRANKSVQGSLIAIEPATGKIRAFVGGRNFLGSQFDRLTQAHRQPGSSFKPFVYATALESAFEQQDRYYTPSTLVADQPWSIQIDKAVWQPKNYNGQYNGVVSLRTALAKSMNIATARLAYDVGFYKVYDLARRMGFRNVKPYPSIALGAFEVSPYELIHAYTAFANGGKMVDLQAIGEVVNAKGAVTRAHEPRITPVIHEQTAYLITDMLKTVMNSGTGASIQQWGIHRVIAGKTGTTNDFKDAWFIGYTPDLICLVWVGYDDNTPVGMTGAQAALPIWARFLQKIAPNIPQHEFHMPAGIVAKMIDPYTGKLASESCPSAVRELFIEGTEPLQQCTDADHYLPIENFLGPEPRIQQAQFYNYNTDYTYGNISYDSSNYSYTNYEDQENDQEAETVDYSDTSFPDHDQQQESYDSANAPTQENPSQEEQAGNPQEEEYQNPIVNDYESPDVHDNTEVAPSDQSNESNDVSANQQNVEAVYLAPQPKKKQRHVYTNQDLPQTQPVEQENPDDQNDQDH